MALSGWRESDPHANFGKVVCYHYSTPALCRTATVRSVTVTVRTNDIALRYLGEDGFGTSATDHLGDGVTLLSRISMIKLHDVEREAPPAVQTWNITKFGQRVRVGFPVGALFFYSRGDAYRKPRERGFVRS